MTTISDDDPRRALLDALVAEQHNHLWWGAKGRALPPVAEDPSRVAIRRQWLEDLAAETYGNDVPPGELVVISADGPVDADLRDVG